MKRKTKKLADMDKKYLWHPFTQQKLWQKEKIIVIKRAKGHYLYDVNGKKYLDGVSSLWCNLQGHRVKQIDRAIVSQVRQVAHTTMLGLTNIPAIKLAQKLIEIAPEGLTRVFYSDSGSEGIEIALKMAFQYWQNLGQNRTGFISFKYSYHGDTIGAVSVGGIDLFHRRFKPLLFETIKISSPYSYRCPDAHSLEECGKHCIDELEHVLKLHHRNVAGVILEPEIQCAGGMIIQPSGFVKKVRELCTKYSVLMIADEVATGFGRTGRMFAVNHSKITPDIMVLAKGLTGGYLPLCATLTTEEIYNAFLGDVWQWKTFYHGHTYTGNQLCCSSALANINTLLKNRIIENLSEKIGFLSEELQKFYEIEIVGEVRQKGFIAGIELVRHRRTRRAFLPENQIGYRVCLEARKIGVIIRPLGDVIVVMPPLTISVNELKKLLDVIFISIKKVRKQVRLRL